MSKTIRPRDLYCEYLNAYSRATVGDSVIRNGEEPSLQHALALAMGVSDAVIGSPIAKLDFFIFRHAAAMRGDNEVESS